MKFSKPPTNGPKSSGKAILLMKVVEELPKEKLIYYYMFFLDKESFKDLEGVSKKTKEGAMRFQR